MKANEVKDSQSYMAGVQWQIQTIEHVINEGVSEGDYSDVMWQVDKPIAIDILSGLHKDGWQAEIVHRPTVSATILVHVAYSVMSC